MSEHDEARRQFLHAGCMAAAMAAAALLPRELLAQPIVDISGSPAGPTGREERSYPIPSADGVSIDRVEQVILVRSQNQVFAFNLSCPHQNAAVKWVENDHRFQCTKHDSKYQINGVYTSGRATRNMDRFPIRREANNVIVDLQRIIQSDADPSGWAAAIVKV
jgi:nitrite reductase/ring-hydroxylating ferredoxin subunit